MLIAFGFLHPLLLWALPLAAVPIVIHLLNRRRYDRRPWAAMEFLLAAMKRNRRRLRMEQWLVLLLRTLAVLLLVLLVARPQLSGSLLGTSVTHHVLVVDDSASMAHRSGAESAFDRAREAVQRSVERLAEERGGDLLTVLRSSAPDTPDLAAVPIHTDLPGRVRALLGGYRVGDVSLDPARALGEAARRAAAVETAADTAFRLFTDLRRVDWLDDTGALRDGLASTLSGLEAARARLTIVDVGGTDTENLQVRAIRSVDRVALAGVPLGIEVEVVNLGTAPSTPAELTVGIDGQGRAVRPLPALPPGEATTIALEQTFFTPGAHGLLASLAPDRYPVDDHRALALTIADASKVLLVDGDPGAEPTEAESWYLQMALESDPEVPTGLDVRVADARMLAETSAEDLATFDLVCLCNLARFEPAVVERLEGFAAGGGGVLIALGDQVDPAHYREQLWKDGRGLLPAELLPVAGDLEQPRPVFLAAPDEPMFVADRELFELVFGRLALVGRWFDVRTAPDSAATTLLRVGDADGPPLLVSRPFAGNAGTVHLLTSTSDARWNNLPILPTYRLLALGLHRDAARRAAVERQNLRPDETFVVRIDPAQQRPDVAVRRLAGPDDAGVEAGVTTFAAPAAGTEPVDVAVPMAALTGYGLFAVTRETHTGDLLVDHVARNPLTVEGRLEPLAPATLRAALPPDAADRVAVVRGADGSAGADLASSSGLWRWLGAVMLGAMLLETLLAWRFGRR